MTYFLSVKRPIYPLISLASSCLILVFGLVKAKNPNTLYLLAGFWLLMAVFGYIKPCLAVLPVSAVLCAVFCSLTYFISGRKTETLSAAARILAVCVSVIPGLGLSPVCLVRSFSKIKIPRILTLGLMITLTFFPLLKTEMHHVREAMKTRGAGSLLNPRVLYRAFLIPLMTRLVNISDTLALSVETRGFTMDRSAFSVYKTIDVGIRDILFITILISGIVLFSVAI